MNLNQTIKHMAFIGRAQNKEFAWGKNDCLTFLFGWYDYVYGTDHTKGIMNEYHSRNSALRFWRKYPMSVNQWMHLRKFKKLENEQPVEGDVRIIDHDKRLFPSAFIYHNGVWWAMREGEGTRGVAENTLNDENSTHWRIKNG
jgi:serine protease inhibitor